MLETRRKVKHQLVAEKDKLMKAVDEMKRTGRFSRSQLAKYGLADDPEEAPRPGHEGLIDDTTASQHTQNVPKLAFGTP